MLSILTVITPAETSDLTTKVRVRQELDISSSAEDAKISAWITQASDVIASACNRRFGLETLSEEFRLRFPADALLLTGYPVGEITTVTENGIVLTSDQYEIDESSGRLTKIVSDAVTCWLRGNVTIVYTAGYDLDGGLPPSAIERAAILLIKHYRSQSTRDPLLKSEETEVYGIARERQEFWVGGIGIGSSTEVSDLIAPYRRMVA